MTERDGKGRFINGHKGWNKGKPLSEKHKRKIGQSNRGRLKINIPKEELIRLYLDEKHSTIKIAALYDVSSATILARMDEHGIKRRTQSEANKGKTVSNVIREKISSSLKGRHLSPSTEFKHGHPAYSKPTREIINAASKAKRKFFLSKNELNHLYIEKKLSTPEIAKNLNVTGRTVAIWLKIYGIPRRTNSKSSRLLWTKPDFVKKMMKSLQIKPNRPESKLIQILDDNDLPFTYVGDGNVVIGGLCPDFIHKEENKVIEVFGRVYHDPSVSFKEVTWNRQYWGRKAIFSQLGYDTLIIWDDELTNENRTIERIRRFMND